MVRSKFAGFGSQAPANFLSLKKTSFFLFFWQFIIIYVALLNGLFFETLKVFFLAKIKYLQLFASYIKIIIGFYSNLDRLS